MFKLKQRLSLTIRSFCLEFSSPDCSRNLSAASERGLTCVDILATHSSKRCYNRSPSIVALSVASDTHIHTHTYVRYRACWALAGTCWHSEIYGIPSPVQIHIPNQLVHHGYRSSYYFNSTEKVLLLLVVLLQKKHSNWLKKRTLHSAGSFSLEALIVAFISLWQTDRQARCRTYLLTSTAPIVPTEPGPVLYSLLPLRRSYQPSPSPPPSSYNKTQWAIVNRQTKRRPVGKNVVGRAENENISAVCRWADLLSHGKLGLIVHAGPRQPWRLAPVAVPWRTGRGVCTRLTAHRLIRNRVHCGQKWVVG